MPEVGTFWYDRGGLPTVVRILEDGSECTYLELNAMPYVPYYERIRRVPRQRFLATYQREPAISSEWLDVGSEWFNRTNSDQTLQVMEGCDLTTLSVTAMNFRGPPLVYSIGDLTRQFIRISDPRRNPWQMYFWVIGEGIRVPFTAEIEARAYAFDTGALLGIPLRIYRRDCSYRPPVDSQAFMQAAQRMVDNEPDAEMMEEDFEPEPSSVTPDAPALMPLSAARGPSLWDHLTAEEEPGA